MKIYIQQVATDEAAKPIAFTDQEPQKKRPRPANQIPPILTADTRIKESNVSFYCQIHKQYKAFLRCPVCEYYNRTCAQLPREHRVYLEALPLFMLTAVKWGKPRRVKMYIAKMRDGSLRELPDFDPKDDVDDLEMFRDVDEILCVTKVLKRRVAWAPVSADRRKEVMAADEATNQPSALQRKSVAEAPPTEEPKKKRAPRKKKEA